MDNAVEFEFITPLCRKLTVDGTPVEISPLVVEELGVATQVVRPFIELVEGTSGETKAAIEKALEGNPVSQAEKQVIVFWLFGALETHRHVVFGVVAVLARQPVEWVRTRLPDRLIVLLLLGVEVNADFFARMAPAVFGLVKGLQMPGTRSTSAGPKPSSSSSPTATGTTTSAATPSASSGPTSNSPSAESSATAAT